MHRRTVKLTAIAITSVLAVTAISASAFGTAQAAEPVVQKFLDTHLTASTFANPDETDQVWVRWPLAPTVSNAELQKELVEMKAAGISGAEIGQGTFPPISQLKVILQKANQLGITISLSHGPVSNPDGFSIDDENARKKLVYGIALVDGGATYNAALPAATPATTNRTTVVKVLAYKCATSCSTTATNTLDQSSVVDLTSQLTGTNTDGVQDGTTTGTLSWTAPGTGQWALLAVYSTGSQAQPDLLTDEGFEVLSENMATQFAPIKDLLIANGGDLMYDSHTGDRGSPADTWSNTMFTDFEGANGYDIDSYLPLLVNRPASGFGAAPLAFEFSDSTTAKKFRNDFYQTRTDLWISTQILPLQSWADTYNQQVRLQPYGEGGAAVDSITGAAYTDKTETETLWFGDEVDQYLPEASANHMTGRNWYSIEGSAELNAAYAMTWQDQVVHMNKAFAGGVTKLVYHIYPYQDSSTSTWPGYSLFPNSFGDSWGPRSPLWTDAANVNAYFARNQQVLSQGEAKTDVAVYMQNYVYAQPYGANNLQYWSDPALEQNGYTRDYLNPTLLALPNAKVTNGVLAEDGPSYKAFIFDSTQLPTSAPSRNSVTVDVAKKMLAYAQAGLPVIIVGTPPNSVPGIDAAGDAQVQSLVVDLLHQPATHVVTSEADVPVLLDDLGVEPAAQPKTAGPVLSVHRQDENTDFYWLYNQGSVISAGEPATSFDPSTAGTAVDTTFTLTGEGAPYLLDTWDGTVTPILDYTTDGDQVTVHVKLAKEDTTVIALSTDPSRFDTTASAVHVISTTADSIQSSSDGTIYIRDTTPGTYSTTLSDGRVVTTTIGAADGALDLTGKGWHLDAEVWGPDSSYGTTGTAAAATTKTPVSVSLTSLASWPNIPALTDSSGIGVYTTSFTLPSTWKAGSAAELDLGEVMDSFTIEVNGHDVPFSNQLRTTVDIGKYLKAGANSLKVRVTTTLRNELRTLDPTIGTRPKQQYGLIGPVTVTPYALAKVDLTVAPTPTATPTVTPTPTATPTVPVSAPVVTSQPAASKSVTSGTKVALSSMATGTPSPSVHWQVSTTGGKAWSDIPGATSTTYSFTSKASQTGNRYRAVFINAAGTVTSTETRLVVKIATRVTVKLSDKSISPKKKETVTVTVHPTSKKPTGTVTVHYGSKSTSVKISAAKKGTVRVMLPKLKKGTYKIYATYKGSTVFASDSSPKVTLKVK
jgi:hypothetical protein